MTTAGTNFLCDPGRPFGLQFIAELLGIAEKRASARTLRIQRAVRTDKRF